MCEIKLCKDCKYFEAGFISGCTNENNMKYNYVTGGKKQRMTAQDFREMIGVPYCGKEAKFFEESK